MPTTKVTSLTILALAAAFAAPAQAQTIIQYVDGQSYGYRTEPLYPYVAQPSARAHPQVSSQPAPAARPVSKVNPALIEELRRRGKPKAAAARQEGPKPEPKAAAAKAKHNGDEPPARTKITRTIVVRDKPIVKKTYRVVEHPPVVVQREISEDQLQPQVAPQSPTHAEHVPVTGRIIRAEAEVTILGPDRMSIRLYRKRDGSDANARVDKPASKRNAKVDSKTKVR